MTDTATAAVAARAGCVAVSVAELDARADASARLDLYQALGGWEWNVAPGAYSRCGAWWGRTRYLAQVAEALGSAGGGRQRRGLVSVACCRAVAEVLAGSADHRTGRNAMPGVDSLIERTGWCQRSVQYAIGVLERLGFLWRLSQGRNWLGKTEREGFWYRKSAARRFRAVWALTTPPPARPAGGGHPARPGGAVDNPATAEPPDSGTCTLPHRGKETTPASAFDVVDTSQNPSPARCRQNRRHGLPADTPQRAAPPRPAPTRRRSPWSAELIDLVRDLQQALPGLLGHERPARLAGTLSRFHKAGWDTLSLETLIRDSCAAKGRTLTGHPPTRAYAWLATVLRPINHCDHPQLLAAVDRMYDQLYTDTFCPHDVQRGNQPTAAGVIPCPLCRHSNTQP